MPVLELLSQQCTFERIKEIYIQVTYGVSGSYNAESFPNQHPFVHVGVSVGRD